MASGTVSRMDWSRCSRASTAAMFSATSRRLALSISPKVATLRPMPAKVTACHTGLGPIRPPNPAQASPITVAISPGAPPPSPPASSTDGISSR